MRRDREVAQPQARRGELLGQLLYLLLWLRGLPRRQRRIGIALRPGGCGRGRAARGAQRGRQLADAAALVGGGERDDLEQQRLLLAAPPQPLAQPARLALFSLCVC